MFDTTSDFSVACAIEETVKGAVSFAPPRLPVLHTACRILYFDDPFCKLETRVSARPIAISNDSSRPVADLFSFAHVPSFTDHNIYHKLSPSSLTHTSASLSLFPNPFDLSVTARKLVSVSSHTLPTVTLPINASTSTQPIASSSPASSSLALLSPAITTLTKKPRKPHGGREITNNSLRPHVAAADRLFSWHTPYGIAHDRHLANILPSPLVESAKFAIRGALAPSSKSSYAAGVLRFNQFCDKWDISESDRMPASYALLCAFIGENKGSVMGRTVKSWLSGIRSWHLINHARWEGDDNWVKMARVSANKEGTHHKRPLRAPVSIEHLLALRRAIDIAVPFHAAVWAVALTTFFGCRRLGETTVTTISSFSSQYHVLRSANVTFTTHRDHSRSASFRIPWTKTTREDGASVILTGREDALCPCAALHNHLTINTDIPPAASLFAFSTAGAGWKHMSKPVFMAFCTDIWSKATLTHVLGHSFRIGGAVELLLAGVPPEIVAATGGWTSLAFLLYWRRMEEILPMSTSKAYRQSHLDDLAKIFEAFRVSQKIPSQLVSRLIDDLVIEL
jgi:hypothetical protein